MEHSELVFDLAAALAAAFAGGWVARRLGQPVLIGYLLAGFIIGPNTPGFDADPERVQQLAELGVALLMFGLGVEFSISELLRVRTIVSRAGALQIPLTIAMGTGVGLLSGWSTQAAVLLGGAFAISSSIVTLTWLMSRGEADSPQAHIALGLGVVQDLALVPMIALLPVLAGGGTSVPVELLRSVGIATVALVLVIVLGTRLVPRLLDTVARIESRELFLLVVVLIALGTALASQEAGLSLALGAFLAGLVVSESEYDRQVLSEIIPLRDLFATLFFVSIGMLVDPGYIVEHIPLVAGFTLALVLGKLIIIGGALLAVGVDHTTATLVAIFMAQMGEFSFVLTGAGSSEGIIDSNQFSVILATAVMSILFMPFLVKLAPALVDLSARLPGVSGQEPAIVGEDEHTREELRRHTIICGYGRVGEVLGDALDRRGFQYTVVEINPGIVRALRSRGIRAVYGDQGAGPVLDHAGVRTARILVLASVDMVSTPAAIRHARKVNPSISIITRAQASSEVEALRAAGANEIVQPEFEAGLECIRYVMRRYGVSSQETNVLVGRRRTAHYQGESMDGLASRRDEE